MAKTRMPALIGKRIGSKRTQGGKEKACKQPKDAGVQRGKHAWHRWRKPASLTCRWVPLNCIGQYLRRLLSCPDQAQNGQAEGVSETPASLALAIIRSNSPPLVAFTQCDLACAEAHCCCPSVLPFMDRLPSPAVLSSPNPPRSRPIPARRWMSSR